MAHSGKKRLAYVRRESRRRVFGHGLSQAERSAELSRIWDEARRRFPD